MKIKFQYFYEYIFGNRAEILSDAKSEYKDSVVQRKHKEIQEFFFGGKNHPGIIPEHKRSTFHVALQKINAKALESMLYPREEKTTEEYRFPTDKFITDIFKESGIAANFKDEPDSLPKYIAFFKVAKLIGDFVECNNDADNGNSVAYMHASKLLRVFGQNNLKTLFKPLDNYLQTHNFLKSNTPLHDALVFDIPKNIATFHLARWREIIMKNGNRAFRLFSRAPEIEKRLAELKMEQNFKETIDRSEQLTKEIETRIDSIAKQLNITFDDANEINLEQKQELSLETKVLEPVAPKDFAEALNIAMSISYKRAKEDPELAKLAMRYNLNESFFEKCLEINPVRKKSDNLPNYVINGSEVNHPGYYLVKLPIDDPRAYLLGHITNCCQSIGGHSEQCVIDGVTRPNNGFYVLLKRTAAESKENPSPIINNRINYAKYKIMGQGYAWLSQGGNLTFDSWENLNKSEDKVIVPMLEKFSQEVTKNTPTILRVTIGKGGNTPSVWKLNQQRIYDETMLEGVQYVDSEYQTIIYCNQNKKDTLLADIKNIMENSLKFTEKMIENIFRVDFIYSIEQALGIQKLLTVKTEFFKEFFINQNVKISIPFNKKINVGEVILFWEIATKLYENNILNELSILPKISDSWFDLVYLANGLIALQQSHLLTPETRQFITFGNYYTQCEFFVLLNNSKILNSDTYNRLIENVNLNVVSAKGTSILEGLKYLAKHNMLSLENFNLIIELKVLDPFKSNHVDTAKAIVILQKEYLLTDTIRAYLKSSTSGNKILATTLVDLHNENILNDEIYNILISNRDNISDLGNSFVILKKGNIFTTENRDAIVNYKGSPKSRLSYSYVTLHQAGILNEENKKALGDAGKNHFNLAIGLADLKKENILTDNARIALYSNPKEATTLAAAFKTLHTEKLLTEENIQLLTKNSENSLDLAEGIVNLKQNNIYTQENINYLASAPGYSFAISGIFNHLEKLNLANKTNKELTITYHPKSNEINSFLSSFQQYQFLNDENYLALLTNSKLLFNPNLLLSEEGEFGQAISSLAKQDLLTIENFSDLIVNPTLFGKASRIISMLNNANILNTETRQLYLQNIEHIYLNLLTVLDKAGKLTLRNFKIAINAMASLDNYGASSLTDSLTLLAEAQAIDDINLNIILSHARYGALLAKLFYNLHHHKITLSDDSIKRLEEFVVKTEKLDIENKKEPFLSEIGNLPSIIETLAKNNLLSSENFLNVLNNLDSKNSYEFKKIIQEIDLMDKELVITPALYKLMITNLNYGQSMGRALRELSVAGLLTYDLQKKIITNPTKASFYRMVYLTLNQAKLLPNASLETILNIPDEQNTDVQYAFKALAEHGFLTNDTIKLVLDNYKFGFKLYLVLDACKGVKITIDDESFKLISKNFKYVPDLRNAIESFLKAKILNPDSFKFLVKHIDLSSDLAKAVNSKDQKTLDNLFKKIHAEIGNDSIDNNFIKEISKLGFFAPLEKKDNTSDISNRNILPKK